MGEVIFVSHAEVPGVGTLGESAEQLAPLALESGLGRTCPYRPDLSSQCAVPWRRKRTTSVVSSEDESSTPEPSRAPKRKRPCTIFSSDSDDLASSGDDDGSLFSPGPCESVGPSQRVSEDVPSVSQEDIPPEPIQVSADPYIVCCGSEAAFLEYKVAGGSCDLSYNADIPASQCDFYGMGEDIRRAVFETFKMKELHEWQSDMLRKHLREDGGMKNALVHAPTSGGKTLVAVILLLRTMLVEKKNGCLVLPYVAIVTEKVRELKLLAHKVPSFSVEEYAGAKGVFPIPRAKSTMQTLYVCTPEKATGLWKSLCAEGHRRDEIGLVSVDECHMINDGQRGNVIEELFVSLLRWAGPSLRIVALSATVGNPDVFRVFLGAGRSDSCNLFNVTSRPTKIKEYLVASGKPVPIMQDGEGRGKIMFSDRGQDILDEER
ncbi:hypothetical protein ONE63_001035 [Megalurothrips usitatus]|uniref:Helicase ATP-binding domain-containing protein n=1 Tax=Megalurothrips usitatus TaxID=439358 RepID=A0AAV7XBV6_9NEOP|nr:hypothetical protein ONE63_001035 [Megalurothrips usitatus]